MPNQVPAKTTVQRHPVRGALVGTVVGAGVSAGLVGFGVIESDQWPLLAAPVVGTATFGLLVARFGPKRTSGSSAGTHGPDGPHVATAPSAHEAWQAQMEAARRANRELHAAIEANADEAMRAAVLEAESDVRRYAPQPVLHTSAASSAAAPHQPTPAPAPAPGLELQPQPTVAPQTAAPQTVAPQTAAPQTAAPQTAAPQTAAPQTAAPQTAAPQTAAPQTAAPQTAAPQTAAPQTAAPQTAAPQTAAPQTAAPQTAAPQTAAPHPVSQPAPLEPAARGIEPVPADSLAPGLPIAEEQPLATSAIVEQAHFVEPSIATATPGHAAPLAAVAPVSTVVDTAPFPEPVTRTEMSGDEVPFPPSQLPNQVFDEQAATETLDSQLEAALQAAVAVAAG